MFSSVTILHFCSYLILESSFNHTDFFDTEYRSIFMLQYSNPANCSGMFWQQQKEWKLTNAAILCPV